MPHPPTSSFDAAGLASGLMPSPLRLSLHRVNGRRVHGAAVTLPEEGAVLGSAPLRELLGLHADASLHIARDHARIMPLCGHWMLSLADEHMVCAVNGSKIPWGELYTLAPGDSIQLGFTELRVESAASDLLAEAGLFAAPVATAAQGASADAAQIAAQAGMQPATQAGAQAYLPDPVDSAPMSVEDASASLSLLCLGEAGALDAPDTLDALGMDERAAPAMNTGVNAHADADSCAHADAGRSTDGDADVNTDQNIDEDAGLSPEAALLLQLGSDFAASPTSHALHYQSGQPLDAILAPVVERPELTGLVSLVPGEGPSTAPCAAPASTLGAGESLASVPAAFSPPNATAFSPPNATAFSPPNATAFSPNDATASAPHDATAYGPTDQDFFAQLAQPQPLHSVLSPPTFSVREEAPTPDTPSLAELLDTQDAALTLEDILDGPLHIDDVLRSLEDTASTPPDAAFTLPPDAAFTMPAASPTAPFTLDVLQQEIPPDPLTLLGGVAAAPSAPLSVWDAGLSPLLRREHHQPDLHTPYTLASAAQASPPIPPQVPPKAPHDKEPA